MLRPAQAGTRDEDRRELVGQRRDVRAEAGGPPIVTRPALPARGFQDRGSCAGEPDCTTRQRNTHNTEFREVRYLWHPWFGRTVTVYEALTKGGHRVCRCGFDDQRGDRSVE